MSELIKPDLSKDTTGPFVTRGGQVPEYVGETCGEDRPYVFRLADDPKLHTYSEDGHWSVCANDDSEFDIFLAPKEPKTVFVNVWLDGLCHYYPDRAIADRFAQNRLALLQLEVDDQGVPVDGTVVKRVAL